MSRPTQRLVYHTWRARREADPATVRAHQAAMAQAVDEMNAARAANSGTVA